MIMFWIKVSFKKYFNRFGEGYLDDTQVISNIVDTHPTLVVTWLPYVIYLYIFDLHYDVLKYIWVYL